MKGKWSFTEVSSLSLWWIKWNEFWRVSIDLEVRFAQTTFSLKEKEFLSSDLNFK